MRAFFADGALRRGEARQHEHGEEQCSGQNTRGDRLERGWGGARPLHQLLYGHVGEKRKKSQPVSHGG
jgi:hypothetical protein